MSYRSYSREQDWLLPPSLGELVPGDHPVRFVAEFVDGLDLKQLGIQAEPAIEGAPGYQPRPLLGAWVYGFMARVRSSRKLEQACCENIPFMWLTARQRPDHVTLWRFYKANRHAIRGLLKQTVQLAVAADLVDFAFQAVDGSRMAVSSGDRLRGRKALQKLLEQVEREITAMEQANQAEAGAAGQPATGPQALRGKLDMRERLQRALVALDQVAPAQAKRPAAESGAPAEDASAPAPAPEPDPAPRPVSAPAATTHQAAVSDAGQPTGAAEAAAGACVASAAGASQPPSATQDAKGKKVTEPRVSASDPEAVVVKGRHGFSVGYNGQAVVDGKAQIIVAAAVVACASDCDQLLPMFSEAEAMTGRQAAVGAADMGFFSAQDMRAAEDRVGQLFVPDARERRADGPSKNPFHKQHFVYNAETDTFTCPLQQVLTYAGDMKDRGQIMRMYEGRGCSGCPAQLNQTCTKAKARRIKITGLEQWLREHASKMQTELAKQMMHRRSAVVEPVFASLRERIGLQRFLLRGLVNVTAEWRLACTAHNLLKLWKHWWRPRLLAGLASA